MPRRGRSVLSYKHASSTYRRTRNAARSAQNSEDEGPGPSRRMRIEDESSDHGSPRPSRIIIQRNQVKAASTEVYDDSRPQHSCGGLEFQCSHCHAKHFDDERTKTDKVFTKCCNKGKVRLTPIQTDSLIESLMQGRHEYSKNFMDNIRSINSSLAFASMGCKLATPPGHGPYCFRVNGAIYHRTGALHPEN